MPEGRAQGPSGLSSTHLRVLTKNIPNFARHLSMLGNMLLTDEKAIDRIPALYRYRIQCIPKHSHPGEKEDPNKAKFRPICIQEPILTALHKFLARRLIYLVRMKPYQFCFLPAGIIAARAEVYKSLGENRELLVLDVKNAFGTIPHNQISKMLRTRAPGVQVTSYIERYLKKRHSDDLQGVHEGVGVPQGDPLSMLLFALAIEPVLEQLQQKLGKVVAYADDVIIGLNPDITAAQGIEAAK